MMMTALKVLVSALVLGIVLWLTDAASVGAQLRDADVVWLAISVASLTVLTFLMARRWQLVAHLLSLDLNYRHAVGEYYIAQLINLILPGGVAGDIGRAVRLRKNGDLARAVKSVAAERIIGQSTIFAGMGCALTVALVLPGGIAWPKWVWAGVAVLTGCIFAALLVSRFEGRIGQFLRFVLELMQHRQLLTLSLVIAGLLVFSLYACARATGTSLPPEAWLTLLPLVLSAMLVPLSVAGWGWREGAAAALFPLVGATATAGIAMGIAYGAMMTVAALPGIYFMMQRPDRAANHINTPTSQTDRWTIE